MRWDDPRIRPWDERSPWYERFNFVAFLAAAAVIVIILAWTATPQ